MNTVARCTYAAGGLNWCTQPYGHEGAHDEDTTEPGAEWAHQATIRRGAQQPTMRIVAAQVYRDGQWVDVPPEWLAMGRFNWLDGVWPKEADGSDE